MCCWNRLIVITVCHFSIRGQGSSWDKGKMWVKLLHTRFDWGRNKIYIHLIIIIIISWLKFQAFMQITVRLWKMQLSSLPNLSSKGSLRHCYFRLLIFRLLLCLGFWWQRDFKCPIHSCVQLCKLHNDCLTWVWQRLTLCNTVILPHNLSGWR